MYRKKLNKLLAIFSIFVLFTAQFSFSLSVIVRAEDSAEEIARQEEEAAREAERQAQKQADEAARDAEEAAREAVEDLSPTPTPIPQPTEAISTPIDDVSANNDDSNSELNNQTTSDSSSSQDADINIDNNNSANVDNNVNTDSNTGDNVISGDNPPSPTPTQTLNNNQTPLPTCEDNLNQSADVAGEEDNLLYDSREVDVNGDEQGSTQTFENNSADAIEEDNVTVSNTNCASLTNDQQVLSNTGENTASNNEGVVGTTGDASSTSHLDNQGNINQSDNTNGNASLNSSGETAINESENVTVDNNNQVYSENNVKVESKSGSNTLNNNDGNAELSTGDIDMMVTLLNILNMNITGEDFTHLIVNIFGDITGDVDLDKIANNLGMSEEDIQAIAQNELTERELNSQSQTDVENNNEAIVKNNVDVYGESGNNELSGNEDRTRLLTGRIKILVALINFVNTNYTGTDWYFAMVNIFGNLEGDLILPDPNNFLVEDSNSNIENQTSEEATDTDKISEEKLDVENNNTANVTNNISAEGDSGSNLAYDNEDRVEQETGKVNVITQLTNWINVNISGNNWVLLIVNVFGKWYGQIVGFPGKGNIDAPESGMLMVASGGEGNGPSLDQGENAGGDSSLISSEDTTVTNNNNAQIENNVDIKGVSGANTTNQNEDPVSVKTGWIDISADFLNIANLNVTGKKWMMVLVNIFGDFIGDITFPGAKKTPKEEFLADSSNQNNNGDTNNSQQIGGVDQNNETVSNNQVPQTQPTNTISGKKIIAYNLITDNSSDDISSQDKEVYKTASTDSINNTQSFENNQNSSDTQSVKVMGVTFDASKNTQLILFLIALISYLIALRFWVIRRPVK